MKPINDYLTEHMTMLTTVTLRICGNNHVVYKCSRTGNTLINTLKPIVQYSISHTQQPVFQHHDFITVPNVAIAEHPYRIVDAEWKRYDALLLYEYFKIPLYNELFDPSKIELIRHSDTRCVFANIIRYNGVEYHSKRY